MKLPWDDYLMTIACVVSARSPDPSTKHGAVIVDDKHRILGLGYNGFPRGGSNFEYPTTRPEKYKYVIHAERNAILNCTSRPEGATVYVTGLPCSDCMLTMIQSGISRIVYGKVGSAMVDKDQETIVAQLSSVHQLEMIASDVNPIKVLDGVIEYLVGKGWR